MIDKINTTTQLPRPFLKWAGGKNQLIKQYRPYIPELEQIGRYYEPFIGSAAVYFHLRPQRARLSDINSQLVEIYQVVQQDVAGLIAALQVHKNDRDYYYQIRSQDPDTLTPVQRAARLIYMNRTCYNGLYRENKKGEFNVPFGRYKNPVICNAPRLRAASQALQTADIQQADFQQAVAPAAAGDLVYFDPPYVPLNATSSFTSYHRDGFTAADHHRLATTAYELANNGAHVMLSNSDTSLVRDLYSRPPFRLIEIQARRSINSKAAARGPITELLISSGR